MKYLRWNLFLVMIILGVLFLTNTASFSPQHVSKPLQKTPKPKPGIHEPFSINILDFKTATPDISLGDEQTLHWRVYVNNIRDLRMEITPRIGITPLIKETARESDTILLSKTDYTGKEAWLEDMIRVRPERTTTYTLLVTGKGIGLGGVITPVEQTASVEVKVRRPKIENVEPVVDESKLEINFYAKNKGNADFKPTPININYNVRGRRGADKPVFIYEHSFSTSKLDIKVGRQAKLATIPFVNYWFDHSREKAFSYEELQITIRIEAPSYVFPLESDEDTFTYKWKYPDLYGGIRFEEISYEFREQEQRGIWKYKAIVTVKNGGGASAGPFKVRVFRGVRHNDKVTYLGIKREDFPGLGALQEGAFSFEFQMNSYYDKSTHRLIDDWYSANYFKVEVDFDKEVKESNEENNILETRVRRR